MRSSSKVARKVLDEEGEVRDFGVTVHRMCCISSIGRECGMHKQKDLSVWSWECGYIRAQGSGWEKMAEFLVGSQPQASG